MKIKVYVPAIAKIELLDEDNNLELDDGATLRTVYRKLKIPIKYRAFLTCFVNYEKVKMSTKLNEGDVVSFMTIISGG
ncbi:MoaD/ThiS family protein [Mycoplasmatota bacterium WC44]